MLNHYGDLCRKLMDSHGLQFWNFAFDNAKRRVGQCRYRLRLITLSRHYVNLNCHNEKEITDTILHEIAHALVGSGHGHGPTWKAMAVKIGATPQRCYDSAKVVMPTPVLSAACPECGKMFYKHRMPRRRKHHRSCGPVNGQLEFARV